jgi:DNA-binding transcriptional MerR regulator
LINIFNVLGRFIKIYKYNYSSNIKIKNTEGFCLYYRLFYDRDLAWINGLHGLRKCGFSIKELLDYIELVKQGQSINTKRKAVLKFKLIELLETKNEIDQSIKVIELKLINTLIVVTNLI